MVQLGQTVLMQFTVGGTQSDYMLISGIHSSRYIQNSEGGQLFKNKARHFTNLVVTQIPICIWQQFYDQPKLCAN
jgi:hypothetical protein